ncbi:MAG: hypothetical protein ACRDSR_23095 [Pseudonocardiaceae bacterium]
MATTLQEARRSHGPTRLNEVTARPFLSGYLANGFKEDDLVLESVLFEHEAIRGEFRVDSFFCPGDGIFHLSATMAFNCIGQVGIVYASLDNGFDRKPGEIYQTDLRMIFRKPIRAVRFPVRLNLVQKRSKQHSVRYRMHGSIGDDCFLVDSEFTVPVTAHADLS